jgi:DNA-binding FadR family transcriptional regulator
VEIPGAKAYTRSPGATVLTPPPARDTERPPTEPSPRASAAIVTEIRRKIMAGELTEGEALPSEARLMAQYEVSRPTIREAWRVLESEGLISVRRGAIGGAVVRTPSTAAAARLAGTFLERRHCTLADVHQARNLIEGAVVGDLARRARPAWELATLRRLASDDSPPDLSACLAGHGFHPALLGTGANTTLRLYTALITPIVDEHIRRYLAGAGSNHVTAVSVNPRISHATVVRLIESGDAVLARDFWQQHLSTIEALLSDVRLATVSDLSPSSWR